MIKKTYDIPTQIIDAREAKTLVSLTETYNKMIEPGVVGKAVTKVSEVTPAPIKEFVSSAKDKITDSEIFVKSLEVLGKGFQTLEQLAAKVTLSEEEILKNLLVRQYPI